MTTEELAAELERWATVFEPSGSWYVAGRRHGLMLAARAVRNATIEPTEKGDKSK